MKDSRADRLRRYFADDLRWGRGIQQDLVFDFLMAAADAGRDGIVLDVGAGHQRYKPFFEECLYIAQEHPVAGVLNKGLCSYDILCDARRIPLRDESVDCILSTSSLEHLEYPDQFFFESARVLRPGGRIFVNVPFVYPEHEIPYDFQRPTRYGLERWFRMAGFEQAHVAPASSSIYATTAFLKTAIFEGHRNPARSGSGPVRWLQATSRPGLVARALLYFGLVSPVLALLRATLDRPPTEATIMPIGWIASARKPGLASGRSSPPERVGFLCANVLDDGSFYYAEGAIRERDVDEARSRARDER